MLMTSTMGFFLIRGGIALFLSLFLIGMNFFMARAERKETKETRYHHLNGRANPALSS